MRDWKFWDWVAYAGLFIAAIILALDAALQAAPHLAKRMPDFLKSEIWVFLPLVLVICATVILISRTFGWVGGYSKAPTHLRLQFNPANQDVQGIELENIRTWYALYNTFTTLTINPNQPQAQPQQHVIRSWSLFLTFEKSIQSKQILVRSEGFALPAYEVKQSGDRHAVINFLGDLTGVIDINAIV